MKGIWIAAALVGGLAGLTPVTPAEARVGCGPGNIYRPSLGRCVSKASAQRAGIYRSSRVKRVRAYKRPTVRTARPQERAPAAVVSEPADLRVTPAIMQQIHLRAWLTDERREQERLRIEGVAP